MGQTIVVEDVLVGLIVLMDETIIRANIYTIG
jgi:hypothetical protein